MSNRQRPESTWRWGHEPAGAHRGRRGECAAAAELLQAAAQPPPVPELNTATKHRKDELDRDQRSKASASLVHERLLAYQVSAARASRLTIRVRNSQLPTSESVDLFDFDFDFQPNIERGIVGEASTLSFIEEKRNEVLVGPPGVGETSSRRGPCARCRGPVSNRQGSARDRHTSVRVM